MVEYVIDTEPLIAFFYNEDGHGEVATVLDDIEEGAVTGVMDELNAAELLYKVARIEGTADGEPTQESLRQADRDLRTLQRRGVELERANWRLAGEVKAHGHVSLADAHAVALAHEHDATLLVGADDDFDDLPVDVDVEQFRDHGV